MNIHNVDLCATVVSRGHYPMVNIPEFALCGRSNVGKSSFINALLNRKNLARTSSTPGKTATLNFYNIDNKLMLVDLPGYGFANVSKKEQEKWRKMLNEYLYTRVELVCAIQLVDSRHPPSKQDLEMHNWVRQRQKSALVIATKCDKLSKSALEKNLNIIWESMGLTVEDVLIPFSSVSKMGRDETLELLLERGVRS